MDMKQTLEWFDVKTMAHHIRMSLGTIEEGGFISKVEIEQQVPAIKVELAKFDILEETKKIMSDKLKEVSQ